MYVLLSSPSLWNSRAANSANSLQAIRFFASEQPDQIAIALDSTLVEARDVVASNFPHILRSKAICSVEIAYCTIQCICSSYGSWNKARRGFDLVETD